MTSNYPLVKPGIADPLEAFRAVLMGLHLKHRGTEGAHKLRDFKAEVEKELARYTTPDKGLSDLQEIRMRDMAERAIRRAWFAGEVLAFEPSSGS
jgi:hypothetical protein